jgi:hypothetical protein
MSAGCVIALNAAYYQSQSAMIDKVFPNVRYSLGDINPNFYQAAAPSSPDNDYYPYVRGVLNMWGDMFIPEMSTYPYNMVDPWSFISNATYRPPIISIAGVMDATFNIHQQPIWFSVNPASPTPLYFCMHTQSFSPNFGSTGLGIQPSPPAISPYNTIQGMPPPANDPNFHVSEWGIGSETIYNTFQANKIFSELYLDCQMAHGLDDNCTGCTAHPVPGYTLKCQPCTGYYSDFGDPSNTDQTTTYDYLASRAATFFQAIITGTTGDVTVTKFVEAQNTYYDYYHNTTDTNTQGTNTCDTNSQ